jgi:ABC-type antimicrobial peptide transport system permease subunit
VGRILALEGLVPAQIVGVVADVRSEPAATPNASLYLPLVPEGFGFMRFVARTAPAISVPIDDLRGRLEQIAPLTHVAAGPVSERLHRSMADQRFRASLFGAFAVAALVLAGIGLYAVTAFEVRQRRVEIGVRLALGATPARLLVGVLRAAVSPVALGSAAGLIVAWWAGTFLQSFLHEVDARGSSTLLVVGAVLIITAIAAAWIPALRAARTNPVTALRSD